MLLSVPGTAWCTQQTGGQMGRACNETDSGQTATPGRALIDSAFTAELKNQ